MNLDERDLAAFNSVSNDGHQPELHHGGVGVKQHGLWQDDVEVFTFEGDAKVAVAGVGFEQGNDLLLLPLDDLDHFEGILQGLSGHRVVVINASTACSQVGELTLSATNAYGGTDIQCIGVLNSANQLVNADGFNLFGVFFSVGFCGFNDDLDFFVGFGLCESSFEPGDEVAGPDYADHGAVGATFLMHLVLFRNGFSSGLDQITAFAVVQLIINVNNCSFFHSLASKG